MLNIGVLGELFIGRPASQNDTGAMGCAFHRAHGTCRTIGAKIAKYAQGATQGPQS